MIDSPNPPSATPTPAAAIEAPGNPPSLLPDERRAHLLGLVRRDRTVRVNALASTLGVTPITIRRDIMLLAQRGLVRRVHGGATLPEPLPDPTSRATGATARVASAGNGHGPDRQLTLGMVVPSLDFYWPDVIGGVREAAAEAGVQVVLRGATYDAAEERRQLTKLLEQVGVDGLLVAPTTTGAEGETLVRWLETVDVPVVLVERAAAVGPYREPMESVVSDHATGAGMAVRHLADLGHRRIGLATSVASPTSPHVRRGWREACEHLGLSVAEVPDRELVSPGDATWPAAAEGILDACHATGTTAMLVHSDREAIAIVERCQERGIQVPGDLALVTYDDQVAALCAPPLSAVRPPREAIGRAAVHLLTARVREPAPDRPAHRIVIGPRLVIRDSSAPPADSAAGQ